MPDQGIPAVNHNSELLYRLDEKMSEILRRMGVQDIAISKLGASTEAQYRTLNDRLETKYQTLEDRIRALENFRWWFIGVGAVSGIVFTVAKEFVK